MSQKILERGQVLRMSININISSPDPISELRKDPYAFGLLSKNLDFGVELYEERTYGDFLLLRKRFNGTIGFVMISALKKLDFTAMKSIFDTYKSAVLDLAAGDYREIELFVIAGVISKEVEDFVLDYNQSYCHRAPISLIRNHAWVTAH